MNWRQPPVNIQYWQAKDWQIWQALIKRCDELGYTIDNLPAAERTKVFEEIAPERIA